MTDFTASNGIVVDDLGGNWGRTTIQFEGRTQNVDLRRTMTFEDDDLIAFRERDIAQRDEELGRWRWPENPDYVVYPHPDDAFERMFGPNLDLVILRESDGMTKGYVRDEDHGGPPMDHRAGHILAARSYSEAHSERKPWEDAAPGEVWVLTFDGAEDTFKAYESRFGKTYFTRSRETSTDLVDERITAGRRIWPEDAS